MLLVPYHKGEGGVAEIVPSQGKIRFLVTSGVSPAAVTANHHNVQSWTGMRSKNPTTAEVIELLRSLNQAFGNVQIEWVHNNKGIHLLQMEPLGHSHSEQVKKPKVAKRVFKINSLDQLEQLTRRLEFKKGGIALVLGPNLNLEMFQGELFALIVRFGKRLISIKTRQPISKSSHFANICKHFEIELQSS